MEPADMLRIIAKQADTQRIQAECILELLKANNKKVHDDALLSVTEEMPLDGLGV